VRRELTRQLAVATLAGMLRRTPQPPSDDAPDEPGPPRSADVLDVAATEPDLASLPIVGITRRRLAMLLGVLLATWIVIVFARQVSEASAATGRAEAMLAANAAKRDEIAGLERELDSIQQPRYVLQQARAYGLGGPREIPFRLAPDAPPLDANAPGSAASRVGATSSVSPLERWLTLLFGPGD
jgi:cell division protein FtsB